MTIKPNFAYPTGVLATLLAAGLLLPRVALGADAAAPGTSTAATNEPTQLPPVIVTAQKEPEPAATVPVSVSAVTHDTLDHAGIQSVKEASYYAPNTFVNEFTARAVSNPFFRGLGGSPLNPGVTTFIDGVPQLNSFSSSLELIDVDQVEFVRGPQGALFGRNTAGGLINITSGRPASVMTTAVEGGYGNYNYRDVRVTHSGPIVKDQLGLSIAGGYSARDGYSVNDSNGKRVDSREGEFGKAQLLYHLTDRLEMRFILAGEHDHDGDYALGDLNYIRANPHHVNYDFSGGFNHRDVASGTLLLNYSGSAVDISSISGVVWWKNEGFTDLDYTPAPAATRDNLDRDFQFTQEIRVASAKDSPVNLGDNLKMKWQSGVFLFTQDYLQDALNNFLLPGELYVANQFGPGIPPANSPPNSQYSPQAQLNDFGLGLYAQGTLTAWEKLDLSIGLRGDFEHKRADLRTYFTTPDPFLGPPTLLAPRKDYSEVSPQFSLAYHLGSNHIAYASVARGYKAGGFNPIAPPGNTEYGTEHSWNYEVGYKASYYDNKLETTLALFYIDWQNLQLNQQIVGGGGQFYVGNAGGAASKGVEFELKYRPVAGWDIFGGGGYNEARFLSGSTAFNANANANQNVGGNWLPYAPTYTANFGTEVSWAACRYATLYARAEGDVYGNFQYDASNAARQSAYALANFRAGVRGGHWFLEGWANNATDTHYVPIAIQYGVFGAPSGYVGESGAPATFGFRAGLMF